ncbi:hypothetical protein AB4Y45_44230 [Paraburkholderia sp. EG287A]|uniref:hypothetical protein n=1 Tax=unclassified Paraburkholderia TaxID=2615204 RepID=UPI0034D26670
MYPLTWLWCPQYNYPLSGAVDQTMKLLGAGNPQTEIAITQKFSYGRQLARILAVLEPMARDFYSHNPDLKQEPLRDFDQMLSDIKELRSTSSAGRPERLCTASDIADVMKRWRDDSKHYAYRAKLEEVRTSIEQLIDEDDRKKT